MESASASGAKPIPALLLGLTANWRQFALLMLVNAFVGGMVGLERSVLPLLAEEEFGLNSHTAILSFIVSFGAVKALANLFAGVLGDRLGRKPVLLAGWLAGLPVPLLLMAAPNWGWVIAANLLLGVNQGLAWSTTVIMKIDLVGPARRGLAMGLNEAAGYGAVSLAALAAGYVASVSALRPQPFYLGVGFAVAGLVLSVFFVRETKGHAGREASTLEAEADVPAGASRPSFAQVFLLTSWKDRALFSVSQAGLVNNLNDGMAWGLLPLFFKSAGLDVGRIAALAALYPAVWGVGQLVTGPLSDRWGRKRMIVAGMWLQAAGIFTIPFAAGAAFWAVGLVLLGVGTALVYPTLLAAVSDVAHPSWRSTAVGVYRLWRDGGYAAGALAAGLLADGLGVPLAIAVIGGLTFISGVVVLVRMYETLPAAAGSQHQRRMP